MPQVAIGENLKFTNHWIGIYGQGKLIPSRRAVQALQPAPAVQESATGIVIPADVSTLTPVYEKAVVESEREAGPDSAKTARAESDLGAFLLQIKKAAEAEAPLRRAIALDERNADPAIDADRESLALAVSTQGKRSEAFDLFRQATEGSDARVAARSFLKLAELDPEHAEAYFRNAVAAEEKASGTNSLRVAIALYGYASELRDRKRDPEAEPLLRRALSIQQAAAKSDPRITIEILNALGNLLEGRGQLDEAEKLERSALSLSEAKFGPESTQLALTCTNLADVLWNKKDLRGAGLLYRRAVTIDASIYGPDRPETAADIANLGMLLKDAGQSGAGVELLRRALVIYERTLGPDSDQARFVREGLAR